MANNYTGYSTSVDRSAAAQPHNIGQQGGNAPPGVQGAQQSNGIPPQLAAMWGLEGPAIQGVLAQGKEQTGDLSNQYMQQILMGNLQGQNLQTEAGFSQQGLGLDRQGLGIQQGTLQRQMGLLPQQYGLQTQGFDLTQAQQEYGAGQSLRDLNSSATARGAYTAQGTNQGRADINQNLQFGLQRLGLERQGAQLGFKEQQAQQQDAQKELGLQSQRLGLSGQEINSRLDQALQQLGISNQISKDQVLAEIAKVKSGEISQLGPILGDIANAANVPFMAGG